jgi:hypothetical protein
MPATITRAQFNRRLDELCDKYRDGATPALARQLNEALASFKASVVITETTAPARPAPRPAAAKLPKQEKRRRRIVADVRETLAAAAARPARSPAMAETPTRPLQSPFWKALRETEAAVTISETEAAAISEHERDVADLAALDIDGFRAVCAQVAQTRRRVSSLGAA